MGGVRRENIATREAYKHSTRYWKYWQRTCFCLLFVLKTNLSCSAIVMDRFYKQIPFWAICSIIFFLWTPFFPCCFSERYRDKRKTDVLLNGDFLLLNIPSAAERALVSKYNSKPMPSSSFHGLFFLPQLRGINTIAFTSGRNVFYFLAVDGC